MAAYITDQSYREAQIDDMLSEMESLRERISDLQDEIAELKGDNKRLVNNVDYWRDKAKEKTQ